MNVKFYIKRSKFAVIKEKPKIWLNVSFPRQKKFKICTSLIEKNRPPVRTYSKTKYRDF